MKHRHLLRDWTALAALALLSSAACGTALGQHAAGGRNRSVPHQHFDRRFSNNRYYFNRGYTIHRRPRASIGALYGPHGGRYWYQAGNWYRWHRGAWVVWAAPIGVFVPWLPPYFTTIWWYGAPYYYANDTYYIWDDTRDAYQVVTPPAGIAQRATTRAPPSERLFVYPGNGQSAAQQSQDEFDCHRWALAQSGFDPTLPGGGVPAAQVAQKRSDYLRADAACLKGRGYTVR